MLRIIVAELGNVKIFQVIFFSLSLLARQAKGGLIISKLNIYTSIDKLFNNQLWIILMKNRALANLVLASIITISSSVFAGDKNDWAGPYIGINGALSNGSLQWKGAHQTVDLDAGTNATLVSKNLHDLSGGIQLGYNKKLENNFLVGIEASIDKANTEAHDICFGGYQDQYADCKTKIDALGQISAKIGYLPNDNWLIYAKGGAAYARTKSRPNMINNYSDYNYKTTTDDQWGWLAGAGLETKITDKVRVALEYTYIKFDNTTTFTNGIDTTDEYTPNFTSKISTKLNNVGLKLNYTF